MENNRLLIVSNRLPVTIEKKEGKILLQESSGGLVSGLSSYLDSLKGSAFPSKNSYCWIGWPGSVTGARDKEYVKNKIVNEHNGFPVFLTGELMENFYHGFCNNTVWPLFHYFPSYVKYEEQYWECYKVVNSIFADAVLEAVQPGDVVWIHDYHLMLLPGLLRSEMPDLKIGFFLHIPFPTYEIFSLLPSKWRNGILEGLLGADLLGFHTYDYTQYFLRCVLRILGIESDFGILSYKKRIIKADTFPMGIDYEKFQNLSGSIPVQKQVSHLKKTLTYERILLSIDRLDYTKGILNRLKAYEQFLEKYPEWHGKIIMLLRIIPSRYGIKHYRKMKKQIDEFAGYLNGRFATIDWSPLSYQYDFLPIIPLIAVYKISDILLVTPLRDGMNLISKEYLASRIDSTGVLILSEMAGSSKELGEAVIVNPNNTGEIAEAIKTALEIPIHEQMKRNTIMRERIMKYDVVRWAEEFIQKLHSDQKYSENMPLLLKDDVKDKIKHQFSHSNNSLILLDYDGTLIPFSPEPEKAVPGRELLDTLERLKHKGNTKVVIVSGRDRYTLEKWFGKSGIQLVGEHGAVFKMEPFNRWECYNNLQDAWQARVLPILENYTNRLPGSFVEKKQFSLAWHYRKCDPELASLRQKELTDQLLNLTANLDLQILRGNKVVEIKNGIFNKGTTASKFLSGNNFDFILAAGDDTTDEDMFEVLPEIAYSIKVGNSESCANFYLPDNSELLDLLKFLIH